VTELIDGSNGRRARFRFKTGFEREGEEQVAIEEGTVAFDAGFTVRAAILEHHGPCLGFAVAEPAHANVWKNRLEERGLPTGQWLQALKRAVAEGQPDAHPIALPGGGSAALGTLRDIVTITRGQKIGYVTDVADTPTNREKIARLTEGADTLFLEARFAATDAAQARERAHLTTIAAGEIARAAGVRKIEPFHFSPRYEGEEERMLAEVAAAFHR
jgi:ribonuclease Z